MSFWWDCLNISLSKEKTRECYIDLGEGLPWFVKYRVSVASTLTDYFGLEAKNLIQIEAKVKKYGFYKTPKGRRWALIADYFDQKNHHEIIFYWPELIYNPINKFHIGDRLLISVDKNDYSKYEVSLN